MWARALETLTRVNVQASAACFFSGALQQLFGPSAPGLVPYNLQCLSAKIR